MRIFIGGSANDEIDEKYKLEGNKLAEAVIENKWDVVYCGDLRGIFGKIYYGLKDTDVDMKLVVSKPYVKYSKEIEDDIDIIPETINETTNVFIQNADAFVFLPGGIGTVYEIMSLIETKRAGEHNREIIIVNINGFFDKLLEMLEQIYIGKFADIKNKENYHIVNTVEDAISYIKEIIN